MRVMPAIVKIEFATMCASVIHIANGYDTRVNMVTDDETLGSVTPCLGKS
jgi:hypothetical protein